MFFGSWCELIMVIVQDLSLIFIGIAFCFHFEKSVNKLRTLKSLRNRFLFVFIINFCWMLCEGIEEISIMHYIKLLLLAVIKIGEHKEGDNKLNILTQLQPVLLFISAYDFFDEQAKMFNRIVAIVTVTIFVAVIMYIAFSLKQETQGKSKYFSLAFFCIVSFVFGLFVDFYVSGIEKAIALSCFQLFVLTGMEFVFNFVFKLLCGEDTKNHLREILSKNVFG